MPFSTDNFISFSTREKSWHFTLLKSSFFSFQLSSVRPSKMQKSLFNPTLHSDRPKLYNNEQKETFFMVSSGKIFCFVVDFFSLQFQSKLNYVLSGMASRLYDVLVINLL